MRKKEKTGLTVLEKGLVIKNQHNVVLAKCVRGLCDLAG